MRCTRLPAIGESEGSLDLAKKRRLHILESGAESVSLGALLGIVLERTLQYRPQRRVQCVQFGIDERMIAWVVVGQQVVECGRQRVNVGAGGGLGVVHLRRSVSFGAIDARFLHANLSAGLDNQAGLGCAEVHQAGLAGVLVNDDVGRLDVVVDNRRLLPGQIGEHTAQLGTPAQNVFDGVRFARHRVALGVLVGQPLKQVISLDMLHHDVIAAALGEIGADVRDAVVAQLGQHAALCLEALLGFLHRLGVCQVEVLEHLLNDATAAEGSHVLHHVDGAHPALAQWLHDAVDAVHHLAGLQGDVGPCPAGREQVAAPGAELGGVTVMMVTVWALLRHSLLRQPLRQLPRLIAQFLRAARVSLAASFQFQRLLLRLGG